MLLFLCSCQINKRPDLLFENKSEVMYKIGDHKSWSKKDFDDKSWSSKKMIPEGNGLFWARKTINILKQPDSLELTGIAIHAFGAYEVFWDGILIGKNGTPGKEAHSKKIGVTDNKFHIPNHLLKIGEHSLALRMSQLYEKKDKRGIYIYVLNYNYLITNKLINTIFINILAGAFLLTSLYYLLLFINDRKQLGTLLFSLTSFLFFLLIIAEYIKFYIPIHYSNFILRLKIIGTLTLFISFLVPYYFVVQFSLKNRKQFTIIYSIILTSIYLFYSKSYDYTAITLSQMMWFSSILIISYAIYTKRKAAIIVLIGLIFSFFIYQISIYDISLFVSFSIITLCMFYLLSVKLKEQRLAFEHSIAESTRLRYELLKKNIQPHFLMNTLTSLIDWVEESPEKGVEFIEALALEFDLLNQVEDQKLIPISQEIALCKSHLNIMRYRKEIDYQWETEGDIENELLKIPPAIIHTLLENGITHCKPIENNSMKFKLIIKNDLKKLQYTFLTYAKVRNTEKERKGGTGFKYIKARLSESYGNKWQFTSEAENHGWKNIIIIEK